MSTAAFSTPLTGEGPLQSHGRQFYASSERAADVGSNEASGGPASMREVSPPPLRRNTPLPKSTSSSPPSSLHQNDLRKRSQGLDTLPSHVHHATSTSTRSETQSSNAAPDQHPNAASGDRHCMKHDLRAHQRNDAVATTRDTDIVTKSVRGESIGYGSAPDIGRRQIDDKSSVTSNSTKASQARDRCRECNEAEGAIRPLIRCATCLRFLHKYCGNPPPSTTRPGCKFVCGKCSQKERTGPRKRPVEGSDAGEEQLTAVNGSMAFEETETDPPRFPGEISTIRASVADALGSYELSHTAPASTDRHRRPASHVYGERDPKRRRLNADAAGSWRTRRDAGVNRAETTRPSQTVVFRNGSRQFRIRDLRPAPPVHKGISEGHDQPRNAPLSAFCQPSALFAESPSQSMTSSVPLMKTFVSVSEGVQELKVAATDVRDDSAIDQSEPQCRETRASTFDEARAQRLHAPPFQESLNRQNDFINGGRAGPQTSELPAISQGSNNVDNQLANIRDRLKCSHRSASLTEAAKSAEPDRIVPLSHAHTQHVQPRKKNRRKIDKLCRVPRYTFLQPDNLQPFPRPKKAAVIAQQRQNVPQTGPPDFDVDRVIARLKGKGVIFEDGPSDEEMEEPAESDTASVQFPWQALQSSSNLFDVAPMLRPEGVVTHVARSTNLKTRGDDLLKHCLQRNRDRFGRDHQHRIRERRGNPRVATMTYIQNSTTQSWPNSLDPPIAGKVIIDFKQYMGLPADPIIVSDSHGELAFKDGERERQWMQIGGRRKTRTRAIDRRWYFMR